MQIYNSLTRRKDELPPPPGPIRMYFCGPTVYQRIHIGNARPFVLSMWLKRWLEETGYDVTLVENVTDINDKIYDAARAEGIGSEELARRATQWYFEDTDDLGLGRPDVEPLATETLGEIVALIEELVARGLAYESSGDVYFRVARFSEYGSLSGVDPEEMVAQEPSDLKEDARDFALWKATKPHEDTAWASPWGRGRPGWHIECSAMAEAHLGNVFEIHGGGTDLRFPHHENELAQSRGAGREFARIWMHNGMLQLAAEKMSKSLGNIVSLREALDRWGREAVLVFFLSGHWSKPIEFSDETMEQAQAQTQTFRDHFIGRDGTEPRPKRAALADALDDDFNTPEALALFHEWRSRGDTASLAWGL
ncbi:MAG: cysteine--tRNA ligase, partial [Actinobacteria bacterium]|nr:cysteine--tRNA ligase [Actinomycetota bacterium]